MHARLAWTLFGLTCVLAVAQVVFLVGLSEPLFSTQHLSDGFPLVTLAGVAGAAIGALIVSRHPRHRIGWLFVLGQLGTVFGVAAQAYARYAFAGGLGGETAGHLAIWVSVQTGAIFAITVLAVLFLLAPDGKLLSPRWRWAVWAIALGMLLNCAAVASVRPGSMDANGDVNPPAGPAVGMVVVVGVALVLVGLVAGIVSLVKRMHRRSVEEAEQLRWIAASAAGLALGVTIAMVAGLLEVQPWMAVLPLMVAYVCVQLFTGIAILRFRLYDIDVIISRAIVLTALSALVAAGYVVVVLAVTAVVDAPAEGRFWPSLLATALVALGVQPLRGRVQRLADRVVYGTQAAPYEALADFSRSLQAAPSAEDLLPRVAEAVGLTVGARRVQVWLDRPGGPSSRFGWSRDQTQDSDADLGADPDLALPVTDAGDGLGGLAVSMPPGRALRAGDRQLLSDFAAQLGRAYRNFRLQSELADRVEELAHQADELAASRRRLLAAQAAGRERFESSINSDVLPHLADIPAELHAAGTALRSDGPGTPLDRAAIDRWVGRTNTALEALRALTRRVFPAQLTHRGLVPALTTQLDRAGLAHILRIDHSVEGRRFDARIESAVYFCAVEFLRELDAAQELVLTVEADTLSLTITGHGSDTVMSGTRHLADRVAAVGGTVRVDVYARVATLLVDIPLTSDRGTVPDLEEPVGAER